MIFSQSLLQWELEAWLEVAIGGRIYSWLLLFHRLAFGASPRTDALYMYAAVGIMAPLGEPNQTSRPQRSDVICSNHDISRSTRRCGEEWIGVRKRQSSTTGQSFAWSSLHPSNGSIPKARISRPFAIHRSRFTVKGVNVYLLL